MINTNAGQQQAPAPSESRRDERERRFVEDLSMRCASDLGAKARLKRSSGLTLEEAPGDALRVFYALRPPFQREERYFLVATLFPLAEHRADSGNLGATLRRARTETNARGLDRRVEVLLDADVEQLAFRLRQAVHFAHSQRVDVDFIHLLKDILWWDAADRRAQRGWARTYFGQALERKGREAVRTDTADAPSDVDDEPEA